MNKVAAGFFKRGLRFGEVVAIILPNVIEYPILLHGIQQLGAIPTTFNPSLTTEEMVHQLKDSGSTFIVTLPSLLDKVKSGLSNASINAQVKEVFVIGEATGTTTFSSLIANDGQFPKVEFDPRSTVAVIPYSSGTTGLSKGVELTHYNIVANVLQCIAVQVGFYGEFETSVAFLPLYHIYGMVVLMGIALRKCYTLVMLTKFDLKKFLQIIQDYKATIACVVPPVLLSMTKEAIVDQFDLSSLRIMLCGAAPLGTDIQQALTKRLPNLCIAQAYGMTELSPMSHSSNVFVNLAGSVGQLVPNMKIKILDPETGDELAAGQRGEMCLSGPNVMKGYFKNPKATSHMIDKDGFLHTGDVAYVDENGNLFVVDRIKELIKYNGFQVPPAELEALLLTHPDVADVAVIGKPDVRSGELPMAFVVLKKGRKIGAQEIIEWAEKQTSPHKKLRGGIVFVESIPKSAAGKILRRFLRAKL
eukprot:Phypoly_transcript_07256.p1 GENE.Phypoly_transcript_07256~~Phypoly_transcript_07256.p1  ORF type:complete len:551 (+),score=97.76 Phypoly_transcript_07256:233-1654(+)